MRDLDRRVSGAGHERERVRDEKERIRSESDEAGSNFEQQVSDINNDPDAGFDFDLNPTDEQEHRRSER